MKPEDRDRMVFYIRVGFFAGALFTCLFLTGLKLHEAGHPYFAGACVIVSFLISLVFLGLLAMDDEDDDPDPPRPRRVA